jgi:hypothetical protein
MAREGRDYIELQELPNRKALSDLFFRISLKVLLRLFPNREVLSDLTPYTLQTLDLDNNQK